MSKKFIPILVITLIISSNCSNLMEKPSRAAKRFLSASMTNDVFEVDDLTCENKREEIRDSQEMSAIFQNFGELIVGSIDIEIDLENVEFITIDKTDDLATISVNGEWRAAVNGLMQSGKLDEIWFMVFENDEWKWCGSTMNPSFGSEEENSNGSITSDSTSKPNQDSKNKDQNKENVVDADFEEVKEDKDKDKEKRA